MACRLPVFAWYVNHQKVHWDGMWSAGGAQLAPNYSKDTFGLKCK